ncbi:Spherulation-specific family 4 [Auriculariales sp. MPI-PUGE-AT-0066]|nr:Spherulation-specific family 4 [Auriculariales sp. MPI-PUGE-AT-0066]
MVAILQVLFPLYIYPQDCSISTDVCGWKPLYDALTTYSNIEFTLAINPKNGSGPVNTLPDNDYIAGISALNAFPNAKTIGYVASNKTHRPVNEYQGEVDTYLFWGRQNANLSMHGIFIDEGSNNEEDVQYYKDFSQYIRNQTWPGGPPTVVNNPGTTLSKRYFDEIPDDIYVTFENAWSVFRDSAPFTIWTDPLYFDLPGPRQGVIFHDFNGTTADMKNITDSSAKREFKYVFVTTQPSYSPFSSQLTEFLAAVNATNAAT